MVWLRATGADESAGAVSECVGCECSVGDYVAAVDEEVVHAGWLIGG